GVTISRIQLEHPLQDFFRLRQLTFSAEIIGGSGEDLPGFGLLVQADIRLRKPKTHGYIFRVHLQRFLENSYRLLEFSGTQEFFRHLQVLCAGVIEQSLLGVELSQPQHAFERRLQLGELLIHGDGFYGEAVRCIGIANALEAFNGLVVLAQARVKITHSIGDSKILWIRLQNPFVLSNRILQLALLDELLRSVESLLFVKTKAK